MSQKESIEIILELYTEYYKNFHHWYNTLNIDNLNKEKYTDKYVLNPAKQFTDKVLKFSYNFKEKNFEITPELSRLIFLLTELNNRPTLKLSNETPYTQDKPNFAILITIFLNYHIYIQAGYSKDFLIFLLSYFEQESLTGIFKSKSKPRDKKIAFLYNYILKKSESSLKLQDDEKYEFSNTSILRAIENSQPFVDRKPKRYRSHHSESSSDLNQTKKAKAKGKIIKNYLKRETLKTRNKKQETRNKNTKFTKKL